MTGKNYVVQFADHPGSGAIIAVNAYSLFVPNSNGSALDFVREDSSLLARINWASVAYMREISDEDVQKKRDSVVGVGVTILE